MRQNWCSLPLSAPRMPRCCLSRSLLLHNPEIPHVSVLISSADSDWLGASGRQANATRKRAATANNRRKCAEPGAAGERCRRRSCVRGVLRVSQYTPAGSLWSPMCVWQVQQVVSWAAVSCVPRYLSECYQSVHDMIMHAIDKCHNWKVYYIFILSRQVVIFI